MIKKLLYKLFGLIPDSCLTCEVLRDQLDKSEVERRNLITRLLEKDKPEQPVQTQETFEPIKPQFIPWRVRREMLEAEDRKQAELIRKSKQDIDSLEKELDINHEREQTS